MNRKNLTVILSLALIVSFFLPYTGIGIYNHSGYDHVFNERVTDSSLRKYLWLIVPFSGLMLFIGAVNNERYPISRGLLTWLSLFILIYFLYRMVYVEATFKLSVIPQKMRYGYWISLIATLLLIFYKSRKS